MIGAALPRPSCAAGSGLDPRYAADAGNWPVTQAGAPVLAGRPASWFQVAERPDADDAARPERNGLLWQWAPGAYGTVEGRAPGTLEQNRDLWWRAASGLRTDLGTPVKVGVTVAAPSAPLVLIGVDTELVPDTALDDGRQYGAELFFGDRPVVPSRLDSPGVGVVVSQGQVNIVDDEHRLTAAQTEQLRASVRRIANPRAWVTDPVRG